MSDPEPTWTATEEEPGEDAFLHVAVTGSDAEFSRAMEHRLARTTSRKLQFFDLADLLRRCEGGEVPALCICCGGDGSMNHVLNEIQGAGLGGAVPILYIPNGTGNDFARGVGLLDMDPQAILGLLEQGPPSRLHVGQVNERSFINMATFGEFSKVTPEADAAFKTVAGRWGYFLKGLEKLSDLTPQTYRYQIEDEAPVEASLYGFFVGNARFAGGGFQTTGLAEPREAALDFFHIGEMSLPQLIALGLRMQRGEDLDPEAELADLDAGYRKLQRLTIRSDEPIAMVLDGEPARHREVEVRLSPEPALIYLPEE